MSWIQAKPLTKIKGTNRSQKKSSAQEKIEPTGFFEPIGY
jgi:hypothetical protein